MQFSFVQVGSFPVLIVVLLTLIPIASGNPRIFVKGIYNKMTIRGTGEIEAVEGYTWKIIITTINHDGNNSGEKLEVRAWLEADPILNLYILSSNKVAQGDEFGIDNVKYWIEVRAEGHPNTDTGHDAHIKVSPQHNITLSKKRQITSWVEFKGYETSVENLIALQIDESNKAEFFKLFEEKITPKLKLIPGHTSKGKKTQKVILESKPEHSFTTGQVSIVFFQYYQVISSKPNVIYVIGKGVSQEVKQSSCYIRYLVGSKYFYTLARMDYQIKAVQGILRIEMTWDGNYGKFEKFNKQVYLEEFRNAKIIDIALRKDSAPTDPTKTFAKNNFTTLSALRCQLDTFTDQLLLTTNFGNRRFIRLAEAGSEIKAYYNDVAKALTFVDMNIKKFDGFLQSNQPSANETSENSRQAISLVLLTKVNEDSNGGSSSSNPSKWKDSEHIAIALPPTMRPGRLGLYNSQVVQYDVVLEHPEILPRGQITQI